MATMKAAVLYGNEDIRYADYEKPEPQPGELLIKVMVSGICGSDVPRVLHNGAHFYPAVLGHEFSGDVADIGEGVQGFRAGDRISGAPLVPCMKCPDCQKGDFSLCKNYTFIGSRIQGSFAQYVCIPAMNAVKIADHVSYECGAMFEPSTVAIHGVRRNNYRGGGNVAILGAGTIGLFTLQWVKIFGAASVAVFDISDERLAIARRCGANITVNTLNELPESTAFDYVFETAGQPATMRTAFDIAANKAHVCFIGTPHTDLTFAPELWEKMNRKEFNLTGSWMSYSAPFPGEEWQLTAKFFEKGILKMDDSFIDKRFPLSQADKAFMLYKNPQDVKGKILLVSDE